MSKYHKSSNPFESDEEDEDFVMVGKSKPSPSTKQGGGPPYSSPRPPATSGPISGPQYSQRQNAVSASSYSTSSTYEESNPFDDRREQLLMRIANSENTQLESTQRALASIYDSESMGVATAEVCVLSLISEKNISYYISIIMAI